MPRQRGEIEFLPKRILSLTLMGQRWVQNPNLTLSSYPMKFRGLLGMVVPLAHHTAKFSDGSFAKSDSFHWSRCILWYLNQYPISHDNISTTYTPYTYILNSISHLLYVSLGIHYQRYSTTGINSC